MQHETDADTSTPIHYELRELVCTYRPARDEAGHIISADTRVLTGPASAAKVLGPLVARQPVETFIVACLSARHELLAWHFVSRGCRYHVHVSMPEVFVPACVTPGTVGLVLMHNHPSGDPTPSAQDNEITKRIVAAGELLGFAVVDHLIVGDDGRFFAFSDGGLLSDPQADAT